MQDRGLSEHFRLNEFVNSPTAEARGIDNTPSAAVVERLRALCGHVLEPLRQAMGVPITISSGYRCPRLNRAVGGVRNSQHLYGEAADIHLPDESVGRVWFLWIMDNCQFDQLIWESTPASSRHWIHVSFREGSNRQQVIRNLVKSGRAGSSGGRGVG